MKSKTSTPSLTWKTNENEFSGMTLKAADMLDLSFLEKLEEERKTKGR